MHPFARPIDLNQSFFVPRENDDSDACPNEWLVIQAALGRYVQFTTAFKVKFQRPRPDIPISIKDQLITTVHVYFNGLGVQECHSRRCTAFKDDIHKIIPSYTWNPFRQFAVIFASCYSRAFLHVTVQMWRAASQNRCLDSLRWVS